MNTVLHWKIGGVLLGVVFFLAVLLIKPIGVSTQFVILDGVVADAVDPGLVTETADGYTSTNAYLAKSKGKYAKAIAHPLNYGLIFVLAMAPAAFVSSYLRRGVGKDERHVPTLWRRTLGASPLKRHLFAFVGGIIVLYGARLAGGCTSGHMMSGMMQTAVAGYVFAAGAFLAAIPLAVVMYRTREAQ